MMTQGALMLGASAQPARLGSPLSFYRGTWVGVQKRRDGQINKWTFTFDGKGRGVTSLSSPHAKPTLPFTYRVAGSGAVITVKSVLSHYKGFSSYPVIVSRVVPKNGLLLHYPVRTYLEDIKSHKHPYDKVFNATQPDYILKRVRS